MLAVIGIIVVGLAIMEATVQGDAAAAGDLERFAMWYSLSRGVELLFILFPLGFLAIAVVDLRSPTPMVPRRASASSLAGAALVIPAIVGTAGFRIVAFGPLFDSSCLAHHLVHLARRSPDRLVWHGLTLSTTVPCGPAAGGARPVNPDFVGPHVGDDEVLQRHRLPQPLEDFLRMQEHYPATSTIPKNATMSQNTCQRCPETSQSGSRGTRLGSD